MASCSHSLLSHGRSATRHGRHWKTTWSGGGSRFRNPRVLRRFRDLPEALLAKGKLECAGFDCFLADDNMVRMDWFISNLLGGVKLMVDGDRFTEASKLLNEVATVEFEDE